MITFVKDLFRLKLVMFWSGRIFKAGTDNIFGQKVLKASIYYNIRPFSFRGIQNEIQFVLVC